MLKMKKLSTALLAIILIVLALGLGGCKARTSGPERKKGVRENVIIAENPKLPNDTAISKPISKPESKQETDPAPEEKTRAMLTAAQTGDRSKIQSYIDYDTLLKVQSDQNADAHFRQILQNMKWEIISAKVKDDTAVVCVKITNIDMAVVLPEYFNQATKLEYENALAEEQISNSDMELEYAKLFSGLIAQHKTGLIEKLVDISLKKSGGEWTIAPSVELSDAMLGRYVSVKSRLGENAQVMAEIPELPREQQESRESEETENADKSQQDEEDEWYDEIDQDILD